MRSYYIGTENFRDALNDWMVSRQDRTAEKLSQNKNQIPNQLRNYTKPLYLATVVNDDFINNANIMKGRMDKYAFWTKDVLLAKRISRDQKMMAGEYKILITKTIPTREQVIDLDEFITFMGIPQLSMLGFDEDSLKKIQSYRGVLTTNQLIVTRPEYTILEQQTQQRAPSK